MKIVILSKGYEPVLGIAWSLKMEGFSDIDLLFIGGQASASIVCSSNAFVNKTVISSRDDKEIIKTLIKKYSDAVAKEKIILFPGDDYTTSLADRYRDQLEKIFLMTYVDGHEAGAITKLMDKDTQSKLAKKFGLNIVESWVAECVDSKFIIPSEVIYPCFVKPLVSANGLAKANMAKCDTKSELSEHLKKLVDKGQTSPVIIQKFVDIQAEYLVHGICDGNNIYIPLAHKKLEIARFTRGVTVLGMNMNPKELEPEVSKMKDLLLSLNYHGLFNLDIFCSKDKIYLNEINMRIAGTCASALAAEVNFSSLLVKLLAGELKQWPDLDVKYNTIFINDKTAYEDYILGFRTKKEFKEWNRKAEYHLIMNEQDSEPWNVFKKMMQKRHIKGMIKRIIRRS